MISCLATSSFGVLGYMQPWDERNALVTAVFRSPTWHTISDGSLRGCPRQLDAFSSLTFVSFSPFIFLLPQYALLLNVTSYQSLQ